MHVRYLFFLCPLIILFGCTQKDEVEPEPTITTLIELETPIYEKYFFSERDELFLTTYFGGQSETTTQCYLLDLKTSELTMLFELPGSSHGVAISADRSFFAVSTHISHSTGFEERITLINLSEKTSEILLSSDQNDMMVYAFSPDDRFLLYNEYGYGNQIRRLDLETGEDVQISEGDNAVYRGYSAVKGAMLVDTYSDFYFMDLEGNIVSELVNNLRPAFLYDDGKKLICQEFGENYNYDGDLYTYDVLTSELSQLTDLGVTMSPGDISADGTTLLISTGKDHLDDEGHPTNNYEIYTLTVTNKELRRLTNNSIQDFSIGFYDNDQKVLFTSNANDGKAVYSLNL